MVYIVSLAYAVGKTVEVVDRGENIVRNDVLGNENIDIIYDGLPESIAGELLHKVCKDYAAHLFLYAYLGNVKINVTRKIHHAV